MGRKTPFCELRFMVLSFTLTGASANAYSLVGLRSRKHTPYTPASVSR